MGIYSQAEKSYSDVLFNHILSNKIFPYNDGVLKEVQAGLGGKGRRVDLITRYKLSDTYFAIEVKYFPTNFEVAFKQAGQLYNIVDCAYVAVPAEYISIANENLNRLKFIQIGLIPISLIFQTKIPSKPSARSPNPDQRIKDWLRKHFDNPYYWDKAKFHANKQKKYFMKIYEHVKNYIKTPRTKIALLTLFGIQKIYSYQKYASSVDIQKLGKKFGLECLNKSYKHVDWSCPDLERIGLVESITLDQPYYRLKTQFSYLMNSELEELMNKECGGLKDLIERERHNINDEVGKLLSYYVTM